MLEGMGLLSYIKQGCIPRVGPVVQRGCVSQQRPFLRLWLLVGEVLLVVGTLRIRRVLWGLAIVVVPMPVVLCLHLLPVLLLLALLVLLWWWWWLLLLALLVSSAPLRWLVRIPLHETMLRLLCR